jgi:hypothetical protein
LHVDTDVLEERTVSIFIPKAIVRMFWRRVNSQVDTVSEEYTVSIFRDEENPQNIVSIIVLTAVRTSNLTRCTKLFTVGEEALICNREYSFAVCSETIVRSSVSAGRQLAFASLALAFSRRMKAN